MARRCAVLGSPIAHSLSPLLHRAAYDALSLDWTYEAIEVDEPALAGFLAGLGPDWRGLSLTMPLKRAVLPLLDQRSALVDQTGAANTVLRDEAGGLRGDNTDVAGMVAALGEHQVDTAESALVLGGGATAAAALAALRALGASAVRVAVRDPRRTRDLRAAADRLAVALRVVALDELAASAGGEEVVVSTVPAAASARCASLLAERYRVIFDAVYDPWPTPLTQAGGQGGCVVVTGLDLLLHQAAAQVASMTGRPAPLAAMRAALSSARPYSPITP
jgi:shikimate dehydrogenase